jgi:hypothetical protein
MPFNKGDIIVRKGSRFPHGALARARVDRVSDDKAHLVRKNDRCPPSFAFSLPRCCHFSSTVLQDEAEQFFTKVYSATAFHASHQNSK